MTRSLPEEAPGAEAPAVLARFELWPLPELAESRRAAGIEGEAARGEEDSAYARGYDDGRREAMDEAERTLKRAAGLLVSAAEALEACRAAIVRELEDSVYLLALAVARQLVDREVAADPGIVRDLLQKGFETLPIGSRVEVHLHPEDLEALRTQFGLPAGEGRASEIQWVADLGVERGGCTLETPHRVIDGRIDEMMKELYQRMRDD